MKEYSIESSEKLLVNKSDQVAQMVNRQNKYVIDNRPETVIQNKLKNTIDSGNSDNKIPLQRKENKTGLPAQLKSGIENLSGYSMDDVNVHYNSRKPAQLQAHAYAQGTDIHLGSGQEKHLPHEAWHIVQQKQGRVRPTLHYHGSTAINDVQGWK